MSEGGGKSEGGGGGSVLASVDSLPPAVASVARTALGSWAQYLGYTSGKTRLRGGGLGVLSSMRGVIYASCVCIDRCMGGAMTIWDWCKVEDWIGAK